jgi:hypothetical protein
VAAAAAAAAAASYVVTCERELHCIAANAFERNEESEEAKTTQNKRIKQGRKLGAATAAAAAEAERSVR